MPKQDDDYKALGKAVAKVYDLETRDIKKTLKLSFLKGLASGLGGIIGATILVGLLLWILSFFGELPVVGRFADKLNDTVQQEDAK